MLLSVLGAFSVLLGCDMTQHLLLLQCCCCVCERRVCVLFFFFFFFFLYRSWGAERPELFFQKPPGARSKGPGVHFYACRITTPRRAFTSIVTVI